MMGNNPSTNARSPNSASPSPSGHGHGHEKPSSARRDPRNLIQAQRAPAEPSLTQARGTTTHRTRNSQSQSHSHTQSQSHPPSAQLPYPSPSQSLNSPSYNSSDSQMGQQQSQSKEKPQVVDTRDQPSKPVDVPIPISAVDSTFIRSYSQSVDPSIPTTQDMSYHLTRPPRLPLPIEEEVHTPGSPLLAPADIDVPILDIEALDNEPLPRRSSALSNTTIDEEDAEELRVDKTKATVPTVFRWIHGGDKIYVTGTIFQWNKKQRLRPDENDPSIQTATIWVRPGTHHVRFIVDGNMTCSPELPTTVDFGNNLVNYIEISADDLPKDVPVIKEELLGSPMVEKDEVEPTKPKADEDVKAKVLKYKPVIAPERFISQIPQYLLDLDKAEETVAYQQAAAAIEKLPTPPSLPGFLGKPILNAATPMKDDNSVLIMPNHTVLNHLATSSIKNNVLAVSATTRYRRKYVTTVMYMPTGDD